tara:strand:- start:471 stop:617 length:147 start_codon:yes stop_codon:yes gene_type:complete
MQLFNKVWILWLVLVIIWNFGWSNASPISDVVIAVILSILAYKLNNKK